MKRDLSEFQGVSIPDVLGDELNVVFCGINPGLLSASKGQHFARPGNRFWRTLHESAFTDRLLTPSEGFLLPTYGIGLTDIVECATATASELTKEQFEEGGLALKQKIRAVSPRFLAILGIGAYRLAFGKSRAEVGPQEERIGSTRVWLLPNPSGLNASYQLPALVEHFGYLREAIAPALRDRTLDY